MVGASLDCFLNLVVAINNIGILSITFPEHRIVDYVLSGSVQFGLVSYDMLVVVALPQPTTIGMPPIRLHAARVSNCRYGLVRPYNIAQRRGNPCGCPVPFHPGTHKGHPYRLLQYYDAVNMIGHDYKGIELDCWEPFGQFTPNLADHCTGPVDTLLLFDHVSK